MSVNLPQFPNQIWDGKAANRDSRFKDRAPDSEDWDQIVSEMLAVQAYLIGIIVGTATIISTPLRLTLTADVNNWNPGSFRNGFIKTDGTGNKNITGMLAGQDGEERIIKNTGTDTITFNNAHTSSSAANRFVTENGVDIVLSQNEIVTLLYDKDSINPHWGLA